MRFIKRDIIVKNPIARGKFLVDMKKPRGEKRGHDVNRRSNGGGWGHWGKRRPWLPQAVRTVGSASSEADDHKWSYL